MYYERTEQETPRFGKIFDVIVRCVISPKATLTFGWTDGDRGSTDRAVAHARTDGLNQSQTMCDILGIVNVDSKQLIASLFVVEIKRALL